MNNPAVAVRVTKLVAAVFAVPAATGIGGQLAIGRDPLLRFR
mgnify:CR=1 FL=1